MGHLVIAVVCHQGLGSSLWLKIQVEKIMRRLDVPAHIVQVDVSGISHVMPDVAIGVKYLEEFLEEYSDTVIVVNNILQEEELENKLRENKIIQPYLE